jgi:hypothetical protein
MATLQEIRAPTSNTQGSVRQVMIPRSLNALTATMARPLSQHPQTPHPRNAKTLSSCTGSLPARDQHVSWTGSTRPPCARSPNRAACQWCRPHGAGKCWSQRFAVLVQLLSTTSGVLWYYCGSQYLTSSQVATVVLRVLLTYMNHCWLVHSSRLVMIRATALHISMALP